MNLDLNWLLGALGMLGLFILKEWWDERKDGKKSAEKDLTDKIAELSVAVVELKVQVALLSQRLEPMPKMQQDLTALHVKVREIATIVRDKDHES